MNPAVGFTVREIGKNLFSFQFKTEIDMKEVLSREPWHFDKNVLMLKELGAGEQPLDISFETTLFWIRIYNLSKVARKEKW